MRDLQRRIEELHQQISRLPGGADLAALERSARELLSDARNTPYQAEAQALFAHLAQLSNSSPAPGAEADESGGAEAAPALRGLLRRARIRIEMAGDTDDIDEGIDILSEALALNSRDEEVIAMLQEAARHNGQAARRVTDLFNRYGVDAPSKPESITPPAASPPPPRYPSSAGYPAPERNVRAPGSGNKGGGSGYGNYDIDDMLSQLTESYYSGEYQQTIDWANRILNHEPANLAAQEYRQKAEDNLIRGIVPDHRIPFEARVSYNRANSLVRAGNYEEASKLYREARELAERDGILSWKDVEQALLDIQDLALARELLNEGDRMMATDTWTEALRKYEGALRVVPNDPQAEERVDMVRRVQRDADGVAVKLNMLSGSLDEQVKQILGIRSTLAQIRQLLPTSQRLGQLQRDLDQRTAGIKAQLNDQAQAALNRVRNATSLDDRVILTNEALKLMELAVELDPADTSTSDLMMEARAASGDMDRSRQTIKRAASLVAQNFDSELTQARSMLANLSDNAQDENYRMVVNDLLSRYIERAELALEEGDVSEARQWLDAMREEPFRILGRRSEIYRIENAIRRRQTRTRLLASVAGMGMIFVLGFSAFMTRDSWEPVLFPTATPTETPTTTPTETLTPSITPTASDTPEPTDTPTPSETPSITPTGTWTWTPSPTWTPSWTPTASLTPTHTETPTHTSTPTATATATSTEPPTATPTETLTPSITPTPPELCRLIVTGPTGIFMRETPTTSSRVIAVLQIGQTMEALERQTQLGTANGPLWYYVRVNLPAEQAFGWVRFDTVTEITTCPALP